MPFSNSCILKVSKSTLKNSSLLHWLLHWAGSKMKFTGAVVLGQLKCSHESSEGEEEERWNRKICNSSTGHWPGLLYGFLLWMNRKLQLSVETDEATWQFSDNSVTKVLRVTSCCAGNTAGYKWRLVKGAVVTISTSQSRKAVAVLRIGLTILTSIIQRSPY